MSTLTFVPFHTFLDPAFWSEVNRLRLDEWQLDCPEVPVQATFDLHGKSLKDCCLSMGHEAFNGQVQHTGHVAVVNGVMKLFGTLKDFKDLDRKHLLNRLADQVWTNIKSGLNSKTLATFYFTAFADLKQFNYYFMNCAPALVYPRELKTSPHALTSQAQHSAALQYFKECGDLFFFIDSLNTAKPLEELPSSNEEVTVVFANPASVAGHPGWSARNLLAAIAYHRPTWTWANFLALRATPDCSYNLRISWKPTEPTSTPDAVGWAKPASVSLKLMENSVDMNLKLVRWRLVPQLNLKSLTDLKVLIVGSGTLGCNLARNLLGWGVKNFTFIDNSVVSYNNPVRQSLFTFEDSKAGNKSKSETAADSLKKIYPSVNAKGINMKIPMPGHPFSENERAKTEQTCSELSSLIESHDVVFLVMDSRESRWLPTLLATKFGKLAITVALGFDSFVVMRHGVRQAGLDHEAEDKVAHSSDPNTPVPGSALGCYYCSDVTAPGNSLDDRTLDQNCTITRAGVSGIASGVATELLASLVQHEQGPAAPALLAAVDDNSSILGATPHQVRGFMSRFHFMTPTVRRFSQCTACGTAVQDAYAQRGFRFLEAVFNDSGELEKVSGLLELQGSLGAVSLEDMEQSDSD